MQSKEEPNIDSVIINNGSDMFRFRSLFDDSVSEIGYTEISMDMGVEVSHIKEKPVTSQDSRPYYDK